MEQQGNGQTPGMVVGSSAQMPYGVNPYQPNQMTGASSPAASSQSPQTAGLSASPAQMAQHQLAYQHIHQQQQQQLQQQLQNFWATQYEEIDQVMEICIDLLYLAFKVLFDLLLLFMSAFR